MGYRIAILQNQEQADLTDIADIVEWSDHYPGWAASINLLCERIVPRSAPIVVTGGDDMLPDPNHSAQELAAQFLERFPDTFGVMQPHGDEFMAARHYCGSPFLGRRWIQTMYRATGPMCAAYHHGYADLELYWVATCLHALWSRPDLSHYHDHFTRRHDAKPRYWRTVERHEIRDCRTYLERLASRFPGHEPLGVARELDPAPLAADTIRLAQNNWARHQATGERMERANDRMAAALACCARRGLSPVAIYGAGRHTQALADALLRPPVPVAGIIDDDPVLHGTKLWGYPIVSRDQAIALGVKAVILSSSAMEGELFAHCADLRARGSAVIRLYDDSVANLTLRTKSAAAAA
jgi:hypothetical protein